jgi:hypothetical protein
VSPSELAFLALGLLLGAVLVAASLVAFGNRLGRREIRVTVTRDAVPRRSGTLSQDAFLTSAAEPAPGGPADRRGPGRADAGQRPVATPWQPEVRPAPAPERAPMFQPNRTIVPSASGAVGVAVGVAIMPEVDRELDDMRHESTPDDLYRQPALGTPLERMLRGEHLAMVEVVDAVAGEDSHQRRTWEVLLGTLTAAMADIAVAESVIDFPMGTAFWDSFTVEQCRRVVAALGSMGYHYDGRSGWAGSRVPAYRDLTVALADIGVEPRRVRAWPSQAEIGVLFAGARPAPEELLPAAGPDYTTADMQALLGARADELADLWLAWDKVRPLLLDDQPAAITADSATEDMSEAPTEA